MSAGLSLIKKSRALLLILKIALISLSTTLIAANEELEVVLSTQNSLSPMYLSKIQGQPSLPSMHLENLQKILRFDLNHSGYFSLLSQDESKEKMLSGPIQEAFKKDVALYVVKLSLAKSSLSATLFTRTTGKISHFDNISLSGDINKDRAKIHQLSDAIVEKITGNKGIASLKILYSLRTKKGKAANEWISEIWLTDSDGANTKQITFENNYSVHPLFAPEPNKSRHFLYVSYISGQPKIYYSSIYNHEKGIPIVSLRGNQLLPAISKQGNLISFISDASGRPDLFIQRFDYRRGAIGQPLQLFSFPRATQASSTFSPEGDKVAFVSDKDGSPRIYLCKLDEKLRNRKRPEVRLITKENAQNVTPVWSPDGKKLAYSAKSDGVRQIWIYDFEKDREWQLTNGSGNKENPFWAPDSLHLIFNTEDDYSSEIYVINLNQKESVKITNGPGKKRFPSWEPFN